MTMPMKLEQSWCPVCAEWTVTDLGAPCVWCDTKTIRKRGGWKRPDQHALSRISRRQTLALHAAHTQGQSLRSLSRATWETLGYASPNSCLEGIRAAFHRESLEPRSQPDATTLANTVRRGRPLGETKQEYKRRRRREHGYRDTRTGRWRVVGSAPAEDGDSNRSETETFVPSS